MKRIAFASVAILLATLSMGANAAHISVFAASIDADQAGTTSLGKGSATMTYNSNTGQFDWFVAWEALSGPATSAHFHGPAEPGSTAGVQIAIDESSNPSIGSAILTAEQVADLFAGLWYINIHTALEPGGEIRGQVLPLTQVVPLPAAAWLLLSAVGGLGLLRRKR